MSANNAADRTFTISATNAGVGAGLIAISADGDIGIDTTAGTLYLNNTSNGTINTGTGDFVADTTGTFSAISAVTINLGTANIGSTIQIGTEGTTADTITIGNSNAATTLALTGGDDWSITAGGAVDFNGAAAIGDGGDSILLSGTTITLTANTSGNDITLNLTDNNADALDIQEGANNYINVGTLDAGAAMQFGNATTNPTFGFLGTGLVTIAGSAEGTPALTLTAGDLTLSDGDLILTAGDFSFTGATGVINLSSTLDIDAAGITLDGTTLSIDSTDTTNITMSANNAADRTFTISATNAGVGAGLIAISADGDIGIDTTAGTLYLNNTSNGTINTGTGDFVADTTGTFSAISAVTINLGTANIGSTIQIGTEGTTADTITIGNSNAATTLALTGGDDWSITAGGAVDFNGAAAIGDGGDSILLSGTTITLTANTSGNDITLNLTDNNADALDIQEGANNYINVGTLDAGAAMQFGNATTNPTFGFLGTGLVTIAGSAEGTPALTLTAGDLTLSDGDLILTAGDFSFTGATGVINLSSTLDIDAAGITLDGTTLSIDSTDTTNITMSANNAADRTFTISATNAGVGAGLIAISADGDIGIDTTAGTLYLNNTSNGTINTGTGDFVADTTGTFSAISAVTINLGTANIGSTIQIGTEGTTADTITIGNSNAATTLALTGGDDWSITAGGAVDFNGAAAIGDGGDSILLSGTTITLTANTSGNDITLNLTDNNADALDIQEGANNYINVGTLDAGAAMQFGNATTNPTFGFLGTGAVTIAGSADGTDALILTLGDILVSNGDLDVAGGDFNVTLDAGDTANITKTGADAGDVANIAGTSVNAINGLTVAVTSTADAGAVDAYTGLNVTWTESTDADTFTALNIGNTTTTNSATTGISIGTGWDNAITIAGGEFLLSGGNLQLNDDIELQFGTGNDVQFLWDTADADAHFLSTVLSGSNNWIVSADNNTDWTHAASTNPTLFIQSADQATVADYLSLSHDQTDANIAVGAGDLKMTIAGGDLAFQQATTISTSTGNLTLSASGNTLIPDDKLFVLGTSADQVMLNRSTALNADTALTGVLTGTTAGSKQALAANSLIISNVTTDGDMAFYANMAGDGSFQWLRADASTGDVYAGFSYPASLASVIIEHRDTTNTGSHAALIVKANNTSADAYVSVQTAATQWHMGVDNTDSDSLKFGTGVAIGTSTLMSMTTAGALTIAGSADGTDALILTLGDILVSNGDLDVAGGDFNVTLDDQDVFNLIGTAASSTAGNGAAAANIFTITGPAGQASTGVTGQTGGVGAAASLTAGAGGAVAGAGGIGGAGGAATFAAGAGGNGATTGGAGGEFSITAGAAGTGGNANGGTLTLNSGAVTGSGTSTINIGTADTTVINLGDSTVTKTIDIGGVTSSDASTVNIATEGTAADIIAIGNSNASTTLALTGGDDWSMAATGVLTMSASAAATTAIVITDTDYTNALDIGDNAITGTTANIDLTYFDVAGATGAVTIDPQTTGTYLDFTLETAWTFGTLINADFASGTTQGAGDIIGLQFDFDTNLTGATDRDITGTNVIMNALTQSAANTTTYTGYNISAAGALVQDTAVGTINWKGVNVQMPNITQNTGTVKSIGMQILGGTVTSGTSYALVTDANAGNVGIGTTTPGSMLTVGSSTALTVSSAGLLTVANTTDSTSGSIGSINTLGGLGVTKMIYAGTGIGIGIAPSTTETLKLAGTYSVSGHYNAVDIRPSVTIGAANLSIDTLMIAPGTYTWPATAGAVDLATSARFEAPAFAGMGTSGTIGISSTVYIAAATPAAPGLGTTTNGPYALFVDAGTSRFDGDLAIDGDLDFTGAQEITTTTGDLTINSAGQVIFPDDDVVNFGTSQDIAMVLMQASNPLAANTTLTDVLVGTPVTAATAQNSLMTSNITASGDMAWFLNDGAGNSWEYLRFDGSADLVVFNEAGSDIDFRIESDTNANMFVVDAGLDALGLGTTASSDRLLNVSKSWGDSSNGAGAENYGMFFQTDAIRTTGATSASVIGSRINTSVPASNTQNWTGVQAITSLFVAANAATGSTGTITGMSAVRTRVPYTQGANITNAYGFYVADGLASVGTVGTQYGLYVENLTQGGSDYGIYIAGADTNAIWVDAGASRFDGDVSFLTPAADATGVDIVLGADNATPIDIGADVFASGTLIDVAYDTAEVLTGDLAGLSLNLNTNVTGVADGDLVGFRAQTPALTSSGTTTTNYRGFQISAAGALDTTVEAAQVTNVNWYGLDIQMPNIDTGEAGDTTTSYGMYIRGGTTTDGAGTENQYGLIVDSSAGNVGIGTTAPDLKLHVMGSDASATSNSNAQVTIEHATTSGLQFLTASGNNFNTIYFGDAADDNIGYIEYYHGDDSLYFVTNNAERMRIVSTGYVGINTTAPQSLLDVQGAAGAAGILTLATKELTVVDGDVLGRIDFNAPLESDGSDAILAGASIWAEADDTFSATVNSTELVFGTATTSAAVERMRLESGGNLTFSQATTISTTTGDLTINSAGQVIFPDDDVVNFGTSQDIAMVLMQASNPLAANTTLTDVLVGTPVTAASAQNSLLTSNITASGDMAWFLNDGAGNSWEYLRFDGSADLVVFNEAGSDIDFRVESVNSPNMLTVDAGENRVIIGRAIEISVGGFFEVGGPEITMGVNENFYRALIGSPNVLTKAASGTHAIVASLKVSEPLIGTGSASITNTASIYVESAATEGTNNYALWVDAGAVRLDGGGTSTQVTAQGGVLDIGGATNAVVANNTGTIAIGTPVSIGVTTYTATSPTLTMTDMASLYIAGIPVRSTNIGGSNTPYALWVDAGTSRFDGDLAIDGDLDFTGAQEITTTTGDLTINSAGQVIFPDDDVVNFGTSQDIAMVLMQASNPLAANTTLTDVLVGTPVTAASAQNSLLTSNITASGDMAWFLNDGAGNSWEYLRFDGSADLAVFNEAGSDIDFRIESDGNANMFVVDGGVNTVSIGEAANAAAILNIGGSRTVPAGVVNGAGIRYAAAITTAAGDSLARHMVFAGSLTTAAAADTYTLLSTVEMREPDITLGAGSSATIAATLAITGAPTEGGSNYALFVDAGTSRFDGVTHFRPSNGTIDSVTITASDENGIIQVKDSSGNVVNHLTALATGTTVFNETGANIDFRIESDGTGGGNLFTLDAGLDSIGIGATASDGSIFEITPGAVTRTAVTSVGAFNIPADTINYDNGSGTNAIWAAQAIGIQTLTNDNATLTITDAATFYIAGAPVASTNVAFGGSGANTYSLWVDAGTSRFDGDIIPGADSSLDLGSTGAVYAEVWADAIKSDGAITVTPGAGTNLNVATSTTGNFAVNTTELVVDTGVGVGIGTASPGAALEVTGNILLTKEAARTISVANSTTNAVDGGSLSFTAGNALVNSGNTAHGGAISFTTGVPSTSNPSAANAGSFTFTAGNSGGGLGGGFTFTAGNSAGNNRAGAGYSFTAGNGGGDTGAGGGFTFTAGQGGANGAGNGGVGGTISITAGTAGTGGNSNGGTLTLNSGAVAGSGTSTINLGSANTTNLNIGTAAVADTITIGNNTGATSLALTSGTGSQTHTSSVATGTTTTSGFVFDATAITSGTGIYAITDSVTTGRLLDIATTGNTWTGNGTTNGLVNLASTSTAGTASSSSILFNLARSGANAQLAHTAYGVYSTVTNTNATSGTNIAGYFSASGATTANYGLIVENGNVGIGTTAPSYNLDVNGILRVTPTLIATGGTITASGGYTIHTFTSSGTFTPNGALTTDVLVVAGGGSGGKEIGGGGGGGGVRYETSFAVTAQAYAVTVGAGGAALSGSGQGNNGEDSVFSTITATGGGGGGKYIASPNNAGGSGGSGGGGATADGTGGVGGVGTAGQGNDGGTGKSGGSPWLSAGGGGGGAVGGSATATNAGSGGDGTANSISGSSVTYGGGGGGAAHGTNGVAGNGGAGGGGAGAISGGATGGTGGGTGDNGTANRGGGGGGSSNQLGNSGAGGSGIVIVRYLTPTGGSDVPSLVTTTAGLVGIGNASPSYKLDIATAVASDRGVNIANTAATGTNYGVYSSVTGAATTNIGGYFVATGATTSRGLEVAALTSATSTGLTIGALSGTTANTGINIGAISGASATGVGITIGNISTTGTTNYGIQLGTMTGGTTSNYQISTGVLTSATTTTNAQLNLGGVVTTGGTTNYGINIGALSGTGTTNYGINVTASTATGTDNYGIKIGTISGAASGTNYGLYVDTISGASTANYAAIFVGGNVGIGTTAPQSLLDVQGAAGAAGILTLATKELTVVDGDKLGQINFNAPLESDGSDAILVAGSIWSEADATFSATVNTADLVFATAVSETAAEKMRLTSAGNLAFSQATTVSTSTGNLVLDPSGTITAPSGQLLNFGGAADVNNLVRIGGTLGSTTDTAVALLVDTAITPAANQSSVGVRINPAFTEAASGTHGGFGSLLIDSFTVTDAGADTSLVYGASIGVPGIANGTGAINVMGIRQPTASRTLGNQTAISDIVASIWTGIVTYSSTTNTRTITNPSTVYIEGAPANGGNITFSNGPYALWVAGGTSRFDGVVFLGANNQLQGDNSDNYLKWNSGVFDINASGTIARINLDSNNNDASGELFQIYKNGLDGAGSLIFEIDEDGDINLQGARTISTTTGALGLTSTDGAINVTLGGGAADDFNVDSNTLVVESDNNKVGIGTATPDGKLDVAAPASGYTVTIGATNNQVLMSGVSSNTYGLYLYRSLASTDTPLARVWNDSSDNDIALSVEQGGTGDILQLWDGSRTSPLTAINVFTVKDGGNVVIGGDVTLGAKGATKVANGDFATADCASWTLNAGWACESTVEADATLSSNTLTQDTTEAAGEVYEVQFTLKNYSAGNVTVSIGGVSGTARSANGTFSEIITATGTGDLTFTGAGFTGSIDNVVVRQLTGGDIFATGNVGIGTTAPQSLLDVQGAAGAAGILTLATKELTVVDGDVLGRIDFNAPLESDGSDAILAGASIWAEADDTFSATVNSTELVFGTATTSAAVERMRIDSAGNMVFNQATAISTVGNLTLDTTTGNAAVLDTTNHLRPDGANGLDLGDTTNTWSHLYLGANSGSINIANGQLTIGSPGSAPAIAATAALTINATTSLTVNSTTANVDFIVQGDNITTMIVMDAELDSLAFGSPIVSGAHFTVGNVQAITMLTSVGSNLHIPTQTITDNGGARVLAIGAVNFIGVPTFANASSAVTLTNSANLYIAGAPVAGTNITLPAGSNYSLWVDTGVSRFDANVNFQESAARFIGSGTADWSIATSTNAFQIVQAAGTAGDIYLQGTDTKDFIINNNSVDVNFRISGDNNSNMIVLDAGTDTLAFGTGVSANSFMNIEGSITAASGAGHVVRIAGTVTAAAENDIMAGLTSTSTVFAKGAAGRTNLTAAGIRLIGANYSSTGTDTIANAASLLIGSAPTIGTSNYSLWVAAGTSRFDGDVVPASDGTGNLGTVALTWADVNTVLLNGADINLENNWTMLEAEDYVGYSSGFALDHRDFSRTAELLSANEPGTGERMFEEGRKPVFYVGDDFLEYKGIVIAADGTAKINTTTLGVGNNNALCHLGDGGEGEILGDCPGAPADVAEYYETDGTVQPGDAVALALPRASSAELALGKDTGAQLTVKQAVAGDEKLAVGVVSTLPNLAIGELKDALYPKPVALIGRVPVRVSTANGAIEAGDSLALSETPGVLVKATKAGVVMGRAMEAFDGTSVKRSAKVEELIEYMEEGKLAQRQIESTRAKLQKAINALNREFSPDQGLILMYVSIGWQGGDLSLQQNADGTLSYNALVAKTGLAELGFTITGQGQLAVSKLTTQELCVGATCVTEEKFRQVFGGIAEPTPNNTQNNAELSVAEQQGQLVNAAPLQTQLANLGLIVNTSGTLEVNTLKAQRVEITNPYGLTIYDVVTGQPQCVFSQEGQLRTIAGKCDGIVANTPNNAEPAAQNNAEPASPAEAPQSEGVAPAPVVEEPTPVVEEESQTSLEEGNLTSEPQVVEEPVVEESVVEESPVVEEQPIIEEVPVVEEPQPSPSATAGEAVVEESVPVEEVVAEPQPSPSATAGEAVVEEPAP